MEPKYSPLTIEESLFTFWQKNNLFVPTNEELATKETYTVLMPPPNVTNVLHLGHALNNTVQDVMVRYNRMLGKAAIWKVGVDHAGIATQNVVEKELVKEGTTRETLGKEKFLERVWLWKEKYGSTIENQLKKLGVSGDWENLRFTMDEVSKQGVKEIFVRLYKDGLIYRGEYIVNWCPHCLTALSDEEVEYREIGGQIYYVLYQLKDSDEKVVVATTRPETILGDVALSVNPKDERYKHLIGKSVIVPLVGREIPIIADEQIEIDFGTGVLKITPANDVVDFEIGKKYKLPIIQMLTEKGKMNNLAGEDEGKDRFEYRKIFVKKLQEADLLSEVKNHTHSRGECYRCGTVIEPRVSSQWFVKMQDLAAPAIQAAKEGKVKFTPAKWEKVYYHWMENIRDWCISRQIWWGHPIPAWHCESCGKITVNIIEVTECEHCKSPKIKAETDVLDTWFSSWLWPLTTFGWPQSTIELEKFYPTQFLATAPEIIFFWVARMIMLGLYIKKEVPFKDVFFNATICDIKGQKMSKSLGNGIDPLEIINLYGADSLRFTLLFVAPKGERIKIDTKSFETGYKLVNKIWNASRFIVMTEDVEYITPTKDIFDSWDLFILDSLNNAIKDFHKQINIFDYHALTHNLYHFFWNDFCDWYIESSKIKLGAKDKTVRSRKYSILVFVLEKVITLFHPLIPFITEHIWQMLPNRNGLSLIKNIFPQDISAFINATSPEEKNFISLIKEMIIKIRSLKGDLNIIERPDFSLYVEDVTLREKIQNEEPVLLLLTRTNSMQILQTREKKQNNISLVQTEYILYVEFPKGFNIEKEKIRLKNEIQNSENEIARAKEKLANKQFTEFASLELVENEKEKYKNHMQTHARLLSIIEQI